jgi:hypothetical protein
MVDRNSITPKESKRVSNLLQIQGINALEADALCFMARPLVQTTLPHSRTPGLIYVRTNGKITLEVRASSDYGLPYGIIPRLLLIWITSEATRTKSKSIELGKNLSEFLERLDLNSTGGETGTIRRLKKQMDCLFTSTFYLRFSDDEKTEHQIISPVQKYTCWHSQKIPNQKTLFKNQIDLTQEFYNEILSAPVPLDMRALKILRKSPLTVDVYEWITMKNYSATKPVPIPWAALQFQFGAGYPENTRGRLDFKRNFLKALEKVGTVYDDAKKLRPETNHLLFVPGRPHIKSLN